MQANGSNHPHEGAQGAPRVGAKCQVKESMLFTKTQICGTASPVTFDLAGWEL